MFRISIPVALSAVVLGGCAGYKLDPISPEEARTNHTRDKTTEGYVFYEPQPFIFGTLKGINRETKPSPNGDVTVVNAEYVYEIKYFKDYERPYRFTRQEFLAKNDLKITFQDGWMFTGAESSTDTTGVVTSLVDLANSMIPAAGPVESVKPFVLYRLNYSFKTEEKPARYWLQEVNVGEYVPGAAQ